MCERWLALRGTARMKVEEGQARPLPHLCIWTPIGRILQVPPPTKLTGAGVRPSPGAASSASSRGLGLSPVLWRAEAAAPGDGGTPVVPRRCAHTHQGQFMILTNPL